ncbi:hypothetical protein NDU88_002549 [Pleurodeles waltl]|uniref:Uncharacterized protein n=1 Tax=Pleurodeles waltl TaxID=8319 RepID=A0AAV7MN07_PLEWA|nr:hypothetical protein NDU88_002549 [Pleurodeles waltl]
MEEVLLGQICMKQEQYNELVHNEVTQLGKYAATRVYGKGKWLSANLVAFIKHGCEDGEVLFMMDEQGLPMYGATQVIERFCDYYTDLNTSDILYFEQASADYLQTFTMKWLLDSHRERFMVLLRPAEIVASLKDMPSGKA